MMIPDDMSEFTPGAAPQPVSHRICVAPMMDYTDRHFRYFLRLMTKRTRLYTEMITLGAILNGKRRDLLDFHPDEHPLALQLGGSEPDRLAQCAKIAADAGYDELNLNVGCPSDRVSSGRFGACLMAEPELVAECVSAMNHAAGIPVTIKTRIGIDERDSYEQLHGFVQTVMSAGCEVFIIHARKAWLKGLSPKQNREVPPLRYDFVERLKLDFPSLTIVINGGVQTCAAIRSHLVSFDGVMIGREAVSNPYLFSDIDRRFYDPMAPVLTREGVLEAWLPYLAEQLEMGVPLHRMTRHALGLFQGCAGARHWRQAMSGRSVGPHAGLDVLHEALGARRAAA